MKNDNIFLIRETKRGNKEAFRMLVDMYKDMVHTQAWMILKDTEEAKDIAQETFLIAYRSIKTLKSPEAFGPWLRTIIKNAAKKYLAKRKDKHLTYMDPEELLHFSEPNEESESEQLQLSQIMKKLPREFLEVIALKFQKDLSYDEIADFLGITKELVAIRIFRAKKMLRKLVNNKEPEK